MKYASKMIVAATAFLPTMAFAQEGPDLTYLEDSIQAVGELVEQLIPIVIAIGLLVFIWGLVQFIISSGDEEAKETGKRRMVWGILALFVIVAVWGLVALLAELGGIDVGGTIDTPSVDM